MVSDTEFERWAASIAVDRADRLFLSSNVMHRILIKADELDHLLVQQNALLHGNGPWLRVRFGIIDGDLDLEVPEVWPSESLGYFRRIGQRIADNIQPTLVDETTRLNHKRISVPSSDRVSIPPGFGVWTRQAPSVHKNLTKSVICLIHHDDQLRSLDDLARLRMIVELHDAHRQAMRVGIVLAVVGLPFFHEIGGPWTKRQTTLHSCSNVSKQVQTVVGGRRDTWRRRRTTGSGCILKCT